jgi:hypothetical protein
MTASRLLAIQDSAVNPGLLGFVVVAALGVATWLLIRSMTRQMRKIDLPDDASTDDRAAPSDERTSGERPSDGRSPDQL